MGKRNALTLSCHIGWYVLLDCSLLWDVIYVGVEYNFLLPCLLLIIVKRVIYWAAWPITQGWNSKTLCTRNFVYNFSRPHQHLYHEQFLFNTGFARLNNIGWDFMGGSAFMTGLNVYILCATQTINPFNSFIMGKHAFHRCLYWFKTLLLCWCVIMMINMMSLYFLYDQRLLTVF